MGWDWTALRNIGVMYMHHKWSEEQLQVMRLVDVTLGELAIFAATHLRTLKGMAPLLSKKKALDRLADGLREYSDFLGVCVSCQEVQPLGIQRRLTAINNAICELANFAFDLAEQIHQHEVREQNSHSLLFRLCQRIDDLLCGVQLFRASALIFPQIRL